VIVYTLEDCPNCQKLKLDLHIAGYEFEEKDMSSAESITDLRLGGCFEIAAPVLEVEGKFYNYDQLKGGKFTEII
jgi:hypothetical protein